MDNKEKIAVADTEDTATATPNDDAIRDAIGRWA